MICPKCGSIINMSNHNRCARFPICDFTYIIEKGCDIRRCEYVIFDFETTGISRNDTIIEIGAVKVKDDKIVDRFSMLVNPGKDEYGKQIFITKKIESITGITNNMLLGQKEEKEAVKEFLDFIGDTKIAVGQNVIAFDFRFLKNACRKYGYDFPFTEVIDTLVVARDRLQMKSKSYVQSCSQESLAQYFGFTYNAHRALDDVVALFTIFGHLIEMAEKENIAVFPEKISDVGSKR